MLPFRDGRVHKFVHGWLRRHGRHFVTFHWWRGKIRFACLPILIYQLRVASATFGVVKKQTNVYYPSAQVNFNWQKYYNEWQKPWQATLRFEFSFISNSLPFHWCMVLTKWSLIFLQHCLGRKGDFQVTYKISVYYVTWRVADHLPQKGAPTAFATHRSPTISIN